VRSSGREWGKRFRCSYPDASAMVERPIITWQYEANDDSLTPTRATRADDVRRDAEEAGNPSCAFGGDPMPDAWRLMTWCLDCRAEGHGL
jgi:hypothetical protein